MKFHSDKAVITSNIILTVNLHFVFILRRYYLNYIQLYLIEFSEYK